MALAGCLHFVFLESPLFNFLGVLRCKHLRKPFYMFNITLDIIDDRRYSQPLFKDNEKWSFQMLFLSSSNSNKKQMFQILFCRFLFSLGWFQI